MGSGDQEVLGIVGAIQGFSVFGESSSQAEVRTGPNKSPICPEHILYSIFIY